MRATEFCTFDDAHVTAHSSNGLTSTANFRKIHMRQWVKANASNPCVGGKFSILL